ncbi:MAG: diacylglycerol kinase family protein [candidate division Zixibacteria bacterium]|nr:diacylglycerol kinase family protein [candidate division Zixibacteria bacterium]
MFKRRKRISGKSHFCLLVNKKSAEYDPKAITKLTTAIKEQGGFYTITEPETAGELLEHAHAAASNKLQELPGDASKWGKITALIACGGDGTVNLAARAALEHDMPIGILPLGRWNNIARSLYSDRSTDKVITQILSGKTRMADSAVASGQPFFGSIGLGFVPLFAEEFSQRKFPRLFNFGWASLGSQIASKVKAEAMTIKVDSFRFEVTPIMININLVPYTVGLPMSPVSLTDDGSAEVIFDYGNHADEFSAYTRKIAKGEYVYGNIIRLYRGKVITCQPTKGKTLYLDGELIILPNNSLEVSMAPKQLTVLA